MHLQLRGGAPPARSEEREVARQLAGHVGGPYPPARAGFVVSKAVGSAVARNKVRRRLRHLVRERLPALPAGATLVVRALPAAADLPYARLAADLDAAIAAARTPRGAARRPR